MSLAIFDVDGTLSNCEHRRHHVTGGRKNWKRFFEEMYEDTLNEPVANLLFKLQQAGDTILIVSARPESYRSVTEMWLHAHDIRYAKLYMRKAEDFREDSIVKREILEEIRKDWGATPWIAVDDRDSVIDKAWKPAGIFTVKVGEETSSCKGSPNYYIMVGPSGAGKDHLIKNDPVLSKCFHVSSDNLREVLCKNFKDQSKNMQVFDAAHALIHTALLNGVDTVFNATNIKTADRKKAVLAAPPGVKIHYVVVNRPLEDKLRDGGWRLEVSGLIERHDNTFHSNKKDILRGDGFDITVINHGN